MKKFIGLLLAFIVVSLSVRGNNIQVAAVSTFQSNGNIIINFHVSWENSWRTATTNNYDGAWVFFKYKDYDGKWKPIRFTGTDIVAPFGFNVEVSNNVTAGVGAFVYRSDYGFGTATALNVRLGIEPLPGVYDIRAYAIEMVHVPQGSFYVGDSTGLTSTAYHDGSSAAPYVVTGTGSTITLGSSAGQLSGVAEQSLSATLTDFPSGYNAYWIMKYELSQGGWRDFINSLDVTQQASNGVSTGSPAGTLLTSAGMRGKMKIKTAGVAAPETPAVVGCDYDDDGVYDEPEDGEWIAMTYLNWPNAAAYLDWAGLRPMTELEYEKAGRGMLYPKPAEYAWGTPNITSVLYTITNGGLTTEAISNSSSEGNAQGTPIISGQGPVPTGNLRGGIFATPYSSRKSAGAGYYGAMELTGNVDEFCVTTYNRAGRSFTGKQGNGILSAAGWADVDYWPGINGNFNTATPNGASTGIGVTSVAGIILRGGSYVVGCMQLSERRTPLSAANGSVPAKVEGFGVRGVREAN